MTFTTNIVPFQFHQVRDSQAGKTPDELANSLQRKPDRVERENNRTNEPLEQGEMLILHYA